MAGVLIFKDAFNYYSLVVCDNELYYATRAEMSKNSGTQILWERKDVSLQQIEDARKMKDELVRKLNEGQEVDLGTELAPFFK